MGGAQQILVDIAKLSWHKDQLGKVQKQRKAEYQKTVAKHADFPSLPELQNKFRARDDEQLEIIRGFEHKSAQKLASLQDSLVADLTRIASRCDFPGRSDLKDPRLDPSIKRLESDLVALKDTSQQQQCNCKALQSRVDELEGQNAEQRKSFKEDHQRIEQTFGQQIRKLREELRAEQTSAFQAQEAKFKQELLERDAIVTGLLEKQRQESLNNSDKATVSEVATLRQENATLRSENVSLRSEVLETTRKVQELAEKLEQQVQAANKLREAVGSFGEQVNEQKILVDDHQSKLMHIDTQIWDEMAEISSFAFPKLQEGVDKLQGEVGKLRQSHTLLAGRKESESGSPAPSIALENYERKNEEFSLLLLKKIGGWVDELREKVKSIEQHHTNLRTDFEALSQRTAGLQTEVTSLGQATPSSSAGGASHEYAELQKQYSKQDEEIKKLSEDLAQKTNFLSHQFSILQGQYNNLTTRELAQAMLGQLEQLYPEPRKIVADISQLNETTEQIKKEQAEQVFEVKAAKQVITDLKRQIDDMLLPVLDTAEMLSSNKKRKLESAQSPNGIGACPKINGVHVVNGNRLSTPK